MDFEISDEQEELRSAVRAVLERASMAKVAAGDAQRLLASHRRRIADLLWREP